MFRFLLDIQDMVYEGNVSKQWIPKLYNKQSVGFLYFETFPYRGTVPCQDLKRQVEAQRPVAAPLRRHEVEVSATNGLHETWLWFED